MDAHLMGSKRHELVSIIVEIVNGGRSLHGQPEELPKRDGVFVQRQVSPMKINWDLQLTLRLGDAGYVIDMAVSEENMFDVELVGPNNLE
jgi:hypothetical protein